MERLFDAAPADDGDGARRACDQCRQRKVRCDRRNPCANCATAQYYCSFTGTVSRFREQHHRTLISSQYKNKIDNIESRLEKLTSLVEKMAESHSQTHMAPRPSGVSFEAAAMSQALSATVSTTAAQQASCARGQTDRTTSAGSQDVSEPSSWSPRSSRSSLHGFHHGQSSVTAHAAFAGQFVQDALTSTTTPGPLPAGHPDMRAAVSSLQQLLHMQRQHSMVSEAQLQHVQPLGPKGLAGLPLPPLAAVVDLLRELGERRTVTFTLICAFDSIDAFTDICKRVYFSTAPFSTAIFISVSAGLYYLFQEKAALAIQAAQAAVRGRDDDDNNDDNDDNKNEGDAETWKTEAGRFQSYCLTCRNNLETAMANLNLLQPVCQETVEALIMAESYATEISKPLLAWQLNAAACQAVVALGYHRRDILPLSSDDGAGGDCGGDTSAVDARDHQAVRFWIVYILDRALALRFGRSSILQDYDITLPRQIGPLHGAFAVHGPTIDGWLRHAEVQSRAYETLYSPVALLQPVEQRVRSARLCAELLLQEVRSLAQKKHTRCVDRDKDNGNDSSVMTLLLKADEVSIRSTLTLVYRAVPPGSLDAPPGGSSTFCAECIECARDVVQLHLTCTQLLQRNMHLAPAYMHWTILFSPFIPFIVLFCHAIENCHQGDLKRVQNFKSSLEPFRSISEPVDRLYRLCEMLHDVAALYLEANSSLNRCTQHTQHHQQHEPQQPQQVQQQHQYLHVEGQTNQVDAASIFNDLRSYTRLPGEHSIPMDDRIGHPGMAPFYPAGIELQASQAANWYLDYVNMVGWSELSPSSWPQ